MPGFVPVNSTAVILAMNLLVFFEVLRDGRSAVEAQWRTVKYLALGQ